MNSGETGAIRVTRHGSVAEITIDRPDKRNGFTPAMLHALAAAYTRIDEDADIRCSVLTAAGAHFTGGLDLPSMAPVFASGEPLTPVHLVDPLMLRAPWRRKPLVAAVQGICFTIGIELMLAADIVVAADDCRFAQLEVRRGLMAAGGATLRFAERAGWGMAMRWLLTGDEFDAATALRLGFVQDVVPAGRQRQMALDLAARIAAQAPLAVEATIASLRTAALHGPEAAAGAFDAIQQRLMATEDAAEGVASFRERREARFAGR